LSHNLTIYTLNLTVHDINMQNKLQLHKPTSNLTLYQKEEHCMSTQIFNELPKYTAELLVDKKCFISNLKKYLVNRSFYSLEEFIND
jgi:hypothetical protein